MGSRIKLGSLPTKSGYKRLFGLWREALERLASPAAEQFAWLDQHHFHQDELALEHHEGILMMDQFVEQGLITPQQADLAYAIDRKLSEISGEENAQLWVDDAIEHGPEWQEIRRLAAAALAELAKR